MWVIGVLAVAAGLWAANHYKSSEPKITVTPTPATASKVKVPVKLRLVKAIKSAVAYPNAPKSETISLGPKQTIAPLLDPSKLDEQAAQARMTGNIVEADKLSKLADQVRTAIVAKYNNDPAFKAKVVQAGKNKSKGA